MVKKEYLFLILLLAALAVLCAPVSAAVLEELHTIKNGTVDGGVYVGGGHGVAYSSPYIQNFSVPTGDIIWARLYAAVCGGETINGWMNITYWNGTGVTQNNQYLEYTYDGGANDETEGYYLCSAWGNYWKYWNVTDIIKSGANNATATTSVLMEVRRA